MTSRCNSGAVSTKSWCYLWSLTRFFLRLALPLHTTSFANDISLTLLNSDFPYWVIHGLWPQRNDGSWPSNCGARYDGSKIRDLVPQLERVWPDLERNDEQGFWSHEYTKHGSCSNSTYIHDEHDYFSRSIGLQKQVDLVTILKNGGVTPGGTYSATQVFQAVQAVTNSSPQLHCIGQKLVELRVCVDKNLAYTNCDQHEANCPSTISMPLPPH